MIQKNSMILSLFKQDILTVMNQTFKKTDYQQLYRDTDPGGFCLSQNIIKVLSILENVFNLKLGIIEFDKSFIPHILI